MKNKSIILIIIAMSLIVFIGCSRNFNNPVDPDSDEQLISPSNLSIDISANHEDITLSWEDNSDYEELFVLEMKINNNNYILQSINEDRTHTIPIAELDSTLQYTFRVRARIEDKLSVVSGEAMLDWSAIYPTVPSNFDITILSESQAEITWEPNSDFTEKYVIEQKIDKEEFHIIGETTNAYYIITGLDIWDPNVERFFRIRAKVGDNIFSSPSNEKCLQYNEHGYTKKFHLDAGGSVTSLAFSKDDGYLIVANNNGDLIQYDMYNIATTISTRHSNYRINKVVCSPTAKQFVSASDDGSIKLWEFGSGSMLWEKNIVSGAVVNDICYSKDGNKIAAVAEARAVVVDNNSNEILSAVVSGNILFSVDINNSSSNIMLGSNIGNVFLWNIDSDTNYVTHNFSDAGIVNAVQFNPADDNYYFAGADIPSSNVKLWKVGNVLQSTETFDDKGIRLGKYSADGTKIALASTGNIGCLITATGNNNFISLGSPAIDMQFVDDNIIAFITADGMIKVLRVVLNNILWEGSTYLSQSTAGDISPDDNLIAIGTNDGIVEIFENMGWFVGD
ncbi:MAG: hypothetical protein U9R42_12700 [Bacteroidota bacterium]|nr:hypothetical protein [Bacteroidota bacterium]